MQCTETGADDVVTGLFPRRVVARLGPDRLGGPLPLRRWRALDDRLEQASGRPLPHQLVHVPQMQAELVVPDRVHAGVVLAAEPPEPVAPLRDQDLAPTERGGVGNLWTLARLLVEPFTGVRQELPRDVV